MTLDLSTFDFDKLIRDIKKKENGSFTNDDVLRYLIVNDQSWPEDENEMTIYLDAVLSVLCGLLKNNVYLSADTFTPIRSFKV